MARPNFVEKTFAGDSKTAKFMKIFSLESFSLYGSMTRMCGYRKGNMFSSAQSSKLRVETANFDTSFHYFLIGVSRSELHINHAYEKIACTYVCTYVVIRRPRTLHACACMQIVMVKIQC